MGFYLPKQYQTKLLRAIKEFDMISDKDRVLVGFSGGKDSAFMLYALNVIKRYCRIDFDLEAVTVDIGFANPVEKAPLHDFCNELGVPLTIVNTQIADIIKSNEGKSPCSVCAYFRRAAINNYALENNFNKVALAHHHDDVIETFLMNVLYSGRLSTFLPNTHLTRTGLDVIRPMIYLSEREVIRGMKFVNFVPIKNPCPYSGNTMRAEVKKLIKDLSIKNRCVKGNIGSAMRIKDDMELWPKVIRLQKGGREE